jgi:hypothetical protein
VILEADEQSTVDARRELTDRAALAPTRHDVNQTESFVLVIALDAERDSEYLETGADGHDVGAVANPRHERGRSQQVGGQALRTILSPAEQIERGVGNGVVQSGRYQLNVEAATPGPFGDGETVAHVTVGSEEFGVENADRRHGTDRPSQSLKAV